MVFALPVKAEHFGISHGDRNWPQETPRQLVRSMILSGRFSLEDALNLLRDEDDEVFVCGGEEIYRQALPLAQRIYLTELDRAVEGDSFFPEIPEHFLAIEEEQVTEEESYRFSVLQRI